MPYRSFHSQALHPVSADSDDGDESDSQSTLSRVPLSPISASGTGTTSMTSYDVSNASDSPTPSIIPLPSSVRELTLREEFGRGVNNYSDSVYRMAADKDEIDRLDKQHLLFKDIFGNYPTCIEDVMNHGASGDKKACLDLGCGSGSWLFDFARDFPEADVVGVDLVPLNHTDLPSNCRCEVDDINLGLDHFYGAFDVVHAQLIASGIKDYQNLVNSISRVLRPGGLVILVEWDFCLHDTNKTRVKSDEDAPGTSWWARWILSARRAIQGLGGTVDVTANTIQWLHANPFFEQIACEEYWLPGCQWDETNDLHMQIGSIMRDDIVNFIDSGRPLLLGSGLQESIVDELQHQATMELRTNTFPHYIRMQRVHARRKSYI